MSARTAIRHSVDWAGGAAAMVSAACDAAVGPWDERFFLYSEEVDYAARARRAGFRIEYVPTARIRHHEGGSGSSAALTALLAVNRIRYVTKRGRGGTALFRAAVALHELLRAYDPAHRFALRTVLRSVELVSVARRTRLVLAPTRGLLDAVGEVRNASTSHPRHPSCEADRLP